MSKENENENLENAENANAEAAATTEQQTNSGKGGKPASPSIVNESVKIKKLEQQSSFFEKKLQETRAELESLQSNIGATRNVPSPNPEKAKQGKTLLDDLNELWDGLTK